MVSYLEIDLKEKYTVQYNRDKKAKVKVDKEDVFFKALKKLEAQQKKGLLIDLQVTSIGFIRRITWNTVSCNGKKVY